MKQKNCSLLKASSKLVSIKSLFDYLQKREILIIDPINISFIREKFPKNLFPHGEVWLWNQLSDPDLGVNDILELDDQDVAIFKWVIIDGKVISISNLFEKTSNVIDEDYFSLTDAETDEDDDAMYAAMVDFEDLQLNEGIDEDTEEIDFRNVSLWDVMKEVCDKEKKFVSYFIAEGDYCGKSGTHICLTPYNDLVSYNVLKAFLGSDFEKIKNSHSPDSKASFDEKDLKLPEITQEQKEMFQNMYLEHLQKHLSLSLT
jgi:hypothetical protein